MKGSAAPERPIERGRRAEARPDAAEWPRVPLGEVADYVNGRAFRPKDWGRSGLPIIRIKNLTDPSAPFDYFGGDVSDGHRVDNGDLLVSWSATLDAFIWDRGPAVVNQHIFKVCEYPDRVDRLYLFFALREAMAEIDKLVHGATMKHVTKPMFEGHRIPLPPLAEQERIAEWVSRGMEQAASARRAALDRLAAAEALPAALLREVFEGPQWPIVALGAGLERFEAGTSVVAEGRPAGDHEWGVLKVSAVSWGHFRPHENKAVPPGYVPGEHERVRPGDFLISRANTAELAGAVVLVRETPDNLMLSDKTLRLVIDRTVFVPEYLEFALRTRLARTFIEGNATGTSYSMRNISQPTIRAIPVPKPEVATQRQIVASLSVRLAAVEAMIARCREELDEIESLPAALLRAAFNGAS
ncbi:MAG TPA: restriction endonuclease subunit S [Phycisphaerales bacterium]|nr:restriction endonuclease subunit S [Phycisphaerales bacterium]HMP38520.1 restriction endonuclease subunit S [Phycisphaerales bacterium]